MIKLIAAAGFAFAIASSAQAMPQAPVPQSGDGLMTQVAFGCGPGRTRIHGICVARTTIRQARRCARWYGSTCRYWRYY